jgi:hypothetical protein
MEEAMKCPYLIKCVIPTCEACKDLYEPTVFVIQEYCKTKYHKKCPFYVRDESIKNI